MWYSKFVRHNEIFRVNRACNFLNADDDMLWLGGKDRTRNASRPVFSTKPYDTEFRDVMELIGTFSAHLLELKWLSRCSSWLTVRRISFWAKLSNIGATYLHIIK